MADPVEDRASSIRVTHLRAINAGRKGYVKLETSVGIVGWGEINKRPVYVFAHDFTVFGGSFYTRAR